MGRLIGALSPEWARDRVRSGAEIAPMLIGAYKGADRFRDALRGWIIPRGAPDELAARGTCRRRAAAPPSSPRTGAWWVV